MLGGKYTYHAFQSTIFITFGLWELKNMLAMYIQGGEKFGRMRIRFSTKGMHP
jgi:hypothetical protein